MTLTFRVIGQPRQKGSSQAFVVPRKGVKAALEQGAAVKRTDFRAISTGANPNAKYYEKEIRDEAAKYMSGPLWEDAVMLAAFFVMPRPLRLKGKFEAFIKTPDTDKMLRCVLDALTHVVYRDDAQVVHAAPWKRYAVPGEQPHTTIHVWQPSIEELLAIELRERELSAPLTATAGIFAAPAARPFNLF